MLDPQSDERLLAEETDCLLMGPTERKDSLAKSTSNSLSFHSIEIHLRNIILKKWILWHNQLEINLLGEF